MTAQDQSGSGVPQFLTKLWLLVEDSSTNHLIRWGTDGSSFIVLDQPKFAREVLPQFFKHNNMASFVRQLNMYGFRKRTSIDQGSLKSVREDVEFVHPHFKEGQPSQLELIKRKVSTGKDDPKLKHEEVHKILRDVKGMKVKQEDINGTLDVMKRENQALWSEVMMLRQRHDKQQKIVNRLIQFLLTLVNPVGMKRKQPLAIEAGGPSSSGPSRPAKYSKQISLHGNLDDLLNLQTLQGANMDQRQGTTLSNITGTSSIGGGGAIVSEVTSPVEPTGGTFPMQAQEQQLQPPQMASTQMGVGAPAGDVGSQTRNISDMQVCDVLSPTVMRVVPGLGDIANMPISEILETSSSASVSDSQPIITSPPSVNVVTPSGSSQDGIGMLSPLTGLIAESETIPKPSTSLELIPTDTNGGQQQRAGILQRALSTEEVEQKEQLGSDLSALQANIDSIQSILDSNNPYLSVDPDILLGSLFDSGSDLYGELNPSGNISGTEMIEYNTENTSAPVLEAAAAAAAAEASDDDSLLESLNEDSQALAMARNSRIVQEEID